MASIGTTTYRERLNRPENWTRDYTLPDGHRVFSSVDTSLGLRWAIADESGHTPPETDDGVLLLDIDPDRPLSMLDSESCSIPLLTLDGALTRTIGNAATLLFLSAKFNWPIKTRQHGFEHTYEVKEVAR